MVADLNAVTARVLTAVQNGDVADATTLRFLLRQYRDGHTTDLSDPLGTALAAALDRYQHDSTTTARANWLRLFAEAAAISDDARLASSARSLIADLANEWPAISAVGEASHSIDACLAALSFVEPADLVPRAVEHLERIVGGAYQPGIGLVQSAGPSSRTRGTLGDQVFAASALLSAFEITGRLPYSMLAEELIQLSRRDLAATTDVDVACSAISVWCRLAALHDDDAYRGAAVIAEAADYHRDAGQLLERIASCVETTTDAANYGIALAEWRARVNARDETP